ncbi:signal peptidase I [Gordoniibacillus kamchatkensis]|uniref:signal peptidase I n=1 Tax=Gordoniibacillus kamchatkensis TaxID=1590651 RepID=UPI0006972559|nr:signal peptidase I [Paenibacillus sp. VKM B-2647]
MQLLLLIAMLLAGGEPNHAAAASTPLPAVYSQAEQAELSSGESLIPYITEGDSMSPTIASGDKLAVDGAYYRSHAPERGDIIVFRAPDERIFVKRVIGLPGETIRFERSELYVDGKLADNWPLAGNTSSIEEVKLSARQLYVLGDNYAHSYDSRYIGPIETDSVVGKVVSIEYKKKTASAGAGSSVRTTLAQATHVQPNVFRLQSSALLSRGGRKPVSAFVVPPQPKPKSGARSETPQKAAK